MASDPTSSSPGNPPAGQTAEGEGVAAAVPALPATDPTVSDPAVSRPKADEKLIHDFDLDNDDEEELPTYTASEAAGAFATVFGFSWPYLKVYRKAVLIVAFGLLVETLFNVIMPLSLKFLIDDALGEEDFPRALSILGVLAVAGIVTSVVSIWYERWDARLSAAAVADIRQTLFEHSQSLSASYYSRTKKGEILSRFWVDMAAVESVIEHVANSALLPLFELLAGIILMLVLNWQLALVALLRFRSR